MSSGLAVGAPVVGAPAAAASRRRRRAAASSFFGPAFVAGIAYVDPGNFATNFQAGSTYGYRLIWIVVAANIVAMLVQSLSAKLGLATGQNLAEVSRGQFRRPVTFVLWIQAELVALATELAELVGGAIALQLMLGLPLPAGALVTAIAAYVLTALRDRGTRVFEWAIGVLFVGITVAIIVIAVASHPQPHDMVSGLVPQFAGSDSMLLAMGIIGATVMPHAVYVHSAMTHRCRRIGSDVRDRRRALRLQRTDLAVAMGLAGIVNIAMVVAAAAALGGVDASMDSVHRELATRLGGLVAYAFVLALLMSGLASSGVGTFAGEIVMAGYLRRRVPRPVRRAVTIVPSLAVLSVGLPPATVLVLSQVVLGLCVPFALATLIIATSSRRVMGPFVNRRITTVAATLCTVAVAAVGVYTLAG